MEQIKGMFERAKQSESIGSTEDASVYYKEVIDLINRQRGNEETDGERNSLLARAHNNLGYILYRQVDFDLAVEEYTKALEYEPEMTVALYNRGLIHYRLARFNEAILDLEKVLSLDPGFTSAAQCLEQSRKDIVTQHNKLLS